MPVKRRTSKRRVDPARDYEVWSSIFDAGIDFFGELAEIGVPSNEYNKPDAECACAAWERWGSRYIAEKGREDQRGRQVWALRQFGEPAGAD